MNPKKPAKPKRTQKTIGGDDGSGRFFFVDHNIWQWPSRPIAFKEAADILIDSLLADKGQRRDYLVLPVIYLYRHAIELQLKKMIDIGVVVGNLKKDKPLDKILGNHILAELWTKAKAVISANYQKKEDRKNVLTVAAVLNDFHEADPDGQTIRYASKKNGDINKYETLTDRIHLEHLRDTVNEIWTFLDSWHGGIADCWSAGQDAIRGE